jgi:hypothetical protein
LAYETKVVKNANTNMAKMWRYFVALFFMKI